MLSLEEFLKLPAEEKTKRYLELSEKRSLSCQNKRLAA